MIILLFSRALINQKKTRDHKILDEGDNTSDHLPLMMKSWFELQTSEQVENDAVISEMVNWKKTV